METKQTVKKEEPAKVETKAEEKEVEGAVLKEKIIEAALRQLKLTCLYKGERTAVLEGRRQVAYYIKGFSGAAGIRGEINKCDSIDGIEKILLQICDE